MPEIVSETIQTPVPGLRRAELPNPEIKPDISRSIQKLAANYSRSKPVYSDCWMLTESSQGEVLESYKLDGAEVRILNCPDGQVEYYITPFEYGLDRKTSRLVNDIIERIRDLPVQELGPEPGRDRIRHLARSMLVQRARDMKVGLGEDAAEMDARVEELSSLVCRYTLGMGIFELLMSDPRLEDIYVDAPCDQNPIHVTLSGISFFNSQVRCRSNLMAESRELECLVSRLKRESGLPFSEINPVLETDISGFDCRATVMAPPMSPVGLAMAIRKHSRQPWTLTRLLNNGTMDHWTAGLLSFLVDAKSTFLICGARGAGKSSLLSALLFEFPLSQRILTIEDTSELPVQMMQRMGYKVQSMLIDERRGRNAVERAEEALRVSLRLGESSIVLGEVRGDEARTLYQSMRAGRAGSSVLGTIHGDSAESLYERVVHDLQVPPESFMATDVVISMGLYRPKGSRRQSRRLMQLATPVGEPGNFQDLVAYAGPGWTHSTQPSPLISKAAAALNMSVPEALENIALRGDMREFLHQMQVKHQQDFLAPEWVCRANEFMWRHLESGSGEPATVLKGFQEWFGRVNGIAIQ
ncbi:MAG: type II/IV secretion system ATPase subunit [Candidatus Methanomethylophilaceae archaeon]|nr:type II/IV secretion system ATPase subunit [Candidatus Methanomethylophilaceae archaeon]